MARRAALVVLVALGLGVSASLAQSGKPGRVTGKVKVKKKGEPQADASGVVVYLTGFDEAPPKDVAQLLQENRTFQPSVLPIVKGQEVSFPNLDPNTNHNVFAHEPRFNLGQFRPGRGRPPSRTFGEQLGPVEIYCNIHPEMVATILVLPNRRFARTAADGSFTLDGVPPGTWNVFAYDRHALEPARGQVTVSPGGAAEVSLELNRTRFNFEHKRFDKSDYGKEAYR